MVIYKIFVFGADRKSNMAARAHNVFWLVEIFKIFLLETTKPIELWQCRTLWEFHIFIFFSETTKQIWIKLGRNDHWMVIYKICVFGADRKSNMAARAHNVFWLVEILKIFLLETTKPIELWLCRNDHWVVLY